MLNNQKERATYIYIDEAGDLNENSKSKVFILGCIITDSPELLLNGFSKLKFDMERDLFLLRHKDQFNKEGFHACTNHPDLYSYFLKFIYPLNFRCYFIVINKTSEKFKELKLKSNEEIYNDCIKLLLKDRLVKRKLELNHLIFEQNLPNPSKTRLLNRKNELIKIIENINDLLIEKKYINQSLRFSVELKDKNEELLSIVDYACHIVSKIYEGKIDNNNNRKVEKSMKENYKLFEPKIGSIHDLFKNVYYKIRRKSLDIDGVFIK